MVAACSKSTQPAIARVCGNSASGADPVVDNAGPPATSMGILVIAQGDNLYAIPADGGQQVQLTHETNGNFANNPAYSPDGSWIAYAHRVPVSGGSWGSAEIHVVQADGSDDRTVVPSTLRGERAETPAWSSDGKSIYYAHDVPVVDRANRYSGDDLAIERIGFEGGAPQVVQRNAIEPAISRSGVLLWVTHDSASSSFQLQVRSPDVDQPRTLLTEKDFQAIWTPALSPDGKSIAFSGSGRSDRKVASAAQGIAEALNPLFPSRAEAHGLAWDPWVINSDGSGLKKLASVGSDEQSLAWSPDGQEIAFSNTSSTYLMRADGSGLTRLLTHGDPGGMAWKGGGAAS